jgi:hypothetical protein
VIARTWRCRVPQAGAGAAAAHIARTGIAGCREIAGYRGSQLLCRDAGPAVCELVLVTYWESLGAVRQFAGRDISRAVLYPGDADYGIQADGQVTHSEVVCSDQPGTGGTDDGR